MTAISTFRHSPAKSLIGAAADDCAFAWRREPVVTRLRRIRFDNATIGRSIDVPISATPAVVDDVGVLVGSDDGYVRFLSRDLQKIFWERRLSASIYASLVVDPGARRVIVCDTSGLVCAIGLRGELAWARKLGHPIFATPAIHPPTDSLTIGAFGDMAFGLCLGSGEPCYQANLPAPWYAEVDSPVARRNPYASPAITATGETVFCSGSSVVLLSPDGREIWNISLGADIKSSPIILATAGLAVVTDVSGGCHMIQLESGKIRTRLPLGAKVVASGAHSGTIVAVGATNGHVWGIDCVNDDVAWTSGFGAPNEYGSITTTPLGDFVATSAVGNCVCLAAESGAFLWETSQVMGLPDQATRMDITPIVDRAGRMYGAGYDGSLYQFSFQRLTGGSLS